MESRAWTPARVLADMPHVGVVDDAPGDHTVATRVVWERPTEILGNTLDVVGLGEMSNDYQGVYALHIGDPDFWFKKLQEDYGRDGDAYVVEIQVLPTDVIVEDVQYNMPEEYGPRGDSGILLTTRACLQEGKDFRIVRKLVDDREEKAEALWRLIEDDLQMADPDDLPSYDNEGALKEWITFRYEQYVDHYFHWDERRLDHLLDVIDDVKNAAAAAPAP